MGEDVNSYIRADVGAGKKALPCDRLVELQIPRARDSTIGQVIGCKLDPGDGWQACTDHQAEQVRKCGSTALRILRFDHSCLD
jgi:hypothetical protein